MLVERSIRKAARIADPNPTVRERKSVQAPRGGSGSGVDVQVANTGGPTCIAHAVLTEIQQLNRSREGVEFSAGKTRRLRQPRRRAGGQHWSDLHSTRSAYRNATTESLASGSRVQCRHDAAAQAAASTCRSDLHSTCSAYRNPTADSLARGSRVQCRQDAAAQAAASTCRWPTLVRPA